MTRIFALLVYLICCVNVMAQNNDVFPDTIRLKVDNGKVVKIPLTYSDEIANAIPLMKNLWNMIQLFSIVNITIFVRIPQNLLALMQHPIILYRTHTRDILTP